MDLVSKLVCLLLLVYTYFVSVKGHTYHLGGCASVDPMPDFDMNKFLGKWYAVQKTSTASRCLIYNFTHTDEPSIFKIEQVSEHPILGLVHDNKYHYTGLLKADVESVSAKMTVKFPLSVAGTASYVVYMTDYANYAGVYSCQKLAFANRHSATLLSRTKTLDKIYLDKLRNKLSSFNVNPYDLSLISQANCQSERPYNINITKETFSAHNIGNVVRKAGEKVGDGVEYVIKGVSKYYNKLKKDDDDDDMVKSTEIKISPSNSQPLNEMNRDVEFSSRDFQPFQIDRDAEWL